MRVFLLRRYMRPQFCSEEVSWEGARTSCWRPGTQLARQQSPGISGAASPWWRAWVTPWGKPWQGLCRQECSEKESDVIIRIGGDYTHGYTNWFLICERWALPRKGAYHSSRFADKWTWAGALGPWSLALCRRICTSAVGQRGPATPWETSGLSGEMETYLEKIR